MFLNSMNIRRMLMNRVMKNDVTVEDNCNE